MPSESATPQERAMNIGGIKQSERPLKYVIVEETGEQREVARACRRCYGSDNVAAGVTILSPSGVAHKQSWSDDQRTACGKDATGDNWWWRL